MRRHLQQIWSLIRPYRIRLVLGLACGVLSGLANPVLVLALKVVTQAIMPLGASPAQAVPAGWFAVLPAPLQSWAAAWLNAAPPSSALAIALLLSVVPLAVLGRGLFGYLNLYCMNSVSITVVTQLQERLFRHITRLSLGSLNRLATGDLIKRVHDVHSIQQSISVLLAVLAREPFAILSLVAVLLWNQPRLTMVAFGVLLPVSMFTGLWLRRRAHRQARAFQEVMRNQMNLMEESFTSLRIIKAFNLEDEVAERFARLAGQVRRHFLTLLHLVSLPGPIMEFLGALGLTAFLLYSVVVSKEDPGDLVQFLGGVFLLYAPVKSMARLQVQLEQSRTAADDVFALLKIEPVLLEPGRPKPLKAAGAGIVFDRVRFGYEDQDVLHDIDLTVPAGTVVALVGPSGSGKTTLINLLLRFYDPVQGAIRIGNTDLREVRTHDLHDQVAVVTQETILFNDTIAHNIAVGKAGATPEEIREAARLANALDFIEAKPQGFDTCVGEKGVLLSGGERQRLAIARAVLKKAPILVLDEGLAALDSGTEQAVQEALSRVMHGQTTLCIAHRLSTVQHADLIVVLEHGRIVQQGTHADLIGCDGLYRNLFQCQFRP
jgi:subfamily B ATP-binding cassette protein MsbA